MSTLSINCQWRNCEYVGDERNIFYNHVKHHVPDLEVVSDDGVESYKCPWLNCIYQTNDAREVVWHVNYHGFHAFLKAVGDVLAKYRDLPPCTLSTAESNTIPNKSLNSTCHWNSCNEFSKGPLEFIEHVNFCHIQFLTPKPKQRVKCQWRGCIFATMKKSKLADHMKVHTGEKAAACSHCGQIFANTTKFVNHRHRQLPINENSPQCSHCLVFLPNERLLRIHMRQHVHHYKCCFCDLTCSTPSILSAHIKYRHLPYKPFKCTSCQHVCKSQNDLNRHMMTHSDNYFTCTQQGCNVKFRTEISLARHFEKEHTENPHLKNFACHLCTETFERGSSLTRHLCSVHNVNKPSGYSRFEYRRETDGYFRLQTTRLESLEVVEMSSAFAECEAKFEKDMSDEDVDDPSPVEDSKGIIGKNNVTIDLIDGEGKIITSSVVTKESALPPEAKVVAVGQ